MGAAGNGDAGIVIAYTTRHVLWRFRDDRSADQDDLMLRGREWVLGARTAARSGFDGSGLIAVSPLHLRLR
jgi:hypothetical protein